MLGMLLVMNAEVCVPVIVPFPQFPPRSVLLPPLSGWSTCHVSRSSFREAPFPGVPGYPLHVWLRSASLRNSSPVPTRCCRALSTYHLRLLALPLIHACHAHCPLTLALLPSLAPCDSFPVFNNSPFALQPALTMQQ